MQFLITAIILFIIFATTPLIAAAVCYAAICFMERGDRRVDSQHTDNG